MWKVVRVKYQRALANFTKSGEHDDDFFAYCDGSPDAFYLRECLEIKHDLTSFVEGGILPEDQFDSLKRGCNSGFEMQSPSSKKMKQEVVSTIKCIASKLLGNTASSVDSILKMHKLIEHVENRLATLKSEGRSDSTLENGAAVYRDKLLMMKANLSKMD
ncbi:hypothetical protein PF005_g962 [Phytophthora fragariae]|uniref:Uncharacterized protein n=1 Tax=Phytophthora fragariae TaxID=53985 RepID=A0A6A3UW41_9STRA|nr:hypothetical protein PF003_g27085 [Phytophthora fragariae]KAE8941126.1 hypothetical protein PF009_g9074 [Phytophthora fragariae]KAE9119545.1 hypothetical protein PF007_g8506 [Phytophthora fragariae]KAE9137150.1 hypothetical protein PF010_g1426 [Phytophthora fragariae]KAE9154555.1 hypothetical protein PF006_g1417 [Phytophthora fragariae]